MTDFVTSKDGTRLAYDRLGQGPPLLIVNGAMSVRTFVFARKMAEGLATHFTVYNYDRRGRGESGDKPGTYEVQREVEDVAAMAQAAGGKPFVFAMSSGAALALEAAAAGVPMAGLLAYEPPYTAADPDGKTDREYEANVSRLIAQGKRDEAVAYFMRMVGVPGVGIAVMKMMPMWKVMRGVAHTLPYDARIMGRFEIPAQRFARIRVPTIVANGDKTVPTLKVAAQAAAQAVPKARHVVVPKSNHGVKAKAIAPILVAEFGGRP